MKICYVVHRLPQFGIGGAELQLYLIGTELKTKGHEIHFVVTDPRPRYPVSIGGMKVHQVTSAWGLFSRKSLDAALAEADCDLYLQRGSGAVTYYVYRFCRGHGRKFIFNAAHIYDCTLRGVIWQRRSFVEKELYRQAVLRADALVVMANYMKAELSQWVPQAISVIPSGQMAQKKIWPKAGKPTFLWASIFEDYKRPELFLELAGSIPDAGFLMCGEGVMFESIKLRAPKNLRLLGRVPHEKMARLYGAAWLFVNTSESEGFPNTFIESWLQETPVVSLSLDPDNVITKNKLGFVTETIGRAKTLLASLEGRPARLKRLGKRCRAYVTANHDIRRTASMHESLYKEVLRV